MSPAHRFPPYFSDSLAGPDRTRRTGAARRGVAVVVAVAVVLGLAPAATAQSAAPSGPVRAAALTPGVPQAKGRSATTDVTLVTGDRVRVTTDTAGRQSVNVTAAPRPSGRSVGFRARRSGGDLHVIPVDVAGLRQLDPALFNVSALIRQGYDDARSSTLPLIVQYASGAPAADGSAAGDRRARSLRATSLRPVRSLDSLRATVVRQPKAGASRLVASLTALPRRTGGSPARAASSGPLAGVTRIWLDRRVRAAALDWNLTRVGAPAAWKTGATGKGVRVAVLDSGVDATHPDLKGRVVAAADFAGTGSTTDRNGHGTHVAAIVAGTGKASAGARRGIAYQADLLNGKVLDDDGGGHESAIIAGMEWAVQNRARVVNMSLGGEPGEGLDPLSLAVNRLTATSGALFVVAAGNSGPAPGSVGAPGTADAALTVGATDRADVIADFSSIGPRVGDRGLKPDITAPGDGIVSARAAGTGGSGAYVTFSGTSMAAPHVAGAAALLVQRNPRWKAAELKSGLMGSAVPRAAVSAYRQGAGRLDVARALAQPVLPGRASLDFGYFRYPHTALEPSIRTLSYRNLGTSALTLDLTADLVRDDGRQAPPGTLAVSPPRITVPAGGTGTARVTLDLRAAETGLYSGAVAATPSRAGKRLAAVRTVVGGYKEPESYDLTVTGVGRDGAAAEGSIEVVNVDDGNRFIGAGELTAEGRATFRVPPGNYGVMGLLTDLDQRRGVYTGSVVGVPDVTVTGSTTLSVDARLARPVTAAVAGVTTTTTIGKLAYDRTDANGNGMGSIYLVGADGAALGLFAQPMPEPRHGKFRYAYRATLRAPRFDVTATSGAGPLDARLAAGSPQPTKPRVLSTIDVRAGGPGDYQGVDVSGKLVLARRGDEPVETVVARAATRGAAMVVVYNDEAGAFVHSGENDLPVTTFTLPGTAGTALAEQVRRGATTVRVVPRPASPYAYHLQYPRSFIPGEPGYTLSADDVARLARVDVSFRGVDERGTYQESRGVFRDDHDFEFTASEPVPVPSRRVDYLNTEGVLWDHHAWRDATVAGAETSLTSKQWRTSYRPGERRDHTFFAAPMVNGFMDGVPEARAAHDRDGLTLLPIDFIDTAGNFGFVSSAEGVERVLTVRRDGRTVAAQPGNPARFPVAPAKARYRIGYGVDATGLTRLSPVTSTVWSVTSAAPAGAAPASLPLLLARYRIALDDHNRAATTRAAGPAVGVDLRHQAGATASRITTARLWFSVDDGRRWQELRLVRQPGGGWQAVLPGASVVKPGDRVSLKLSVRDAAGGQLDQTTRRAFVVRR